MYICLSWSPGYKIPKGTRVLVALYALHHNAEVWPDPESFIPERHLGEGAAGAATQPHAWLPFGVCANYLVALYLSCMAPGTVRSCCSHRYKHLQGGSAWCNCWCSTDLGLP